MIISKQQVSWRGWLVCLLVGMLCLEMQAQSRFDHFADQVKRNCTAVCPYTDEIGVTCQKVTCDGKNLHFYLIIPEALLMDMRPDQLKPFYADRLRFNFGINSYINPLYHEAAEVGAGLVYHIGIMEKGNPFDIRYSPSELKQIIADRNTPPYQSISKWRARGDVMLLMRDVNRDADSMYNPANIFNVDSMSLYRQEVRFWMKVNEDIVSISELTESKEYLENMRRNYEEIILFGASNYDIIATAGYDFRLLFHNRDHSDSLTMLFSNQELREIVAHASRLVLADDAFMQHYMQHYVQDLKSFASGEYSGEDIVDVDVHFENGYTNIVFTVKDDSPFLELSPQDAGLLKQSLLPVLKQDLYNEDDGPEVIGDTVVTLELFYRYMKGFHYFYIGEKSRKTIELTLPVEEILAASDMEMPADEDYQTLIARNYVLEEYKQLVKDFSNACPVQQGILTFTDAVYQDNYLQLYVTMDSTAKARNDLDHLREIMSLQLSTSYDAILYTKLAELGSGVVFHFQFYDTLAKILFTPQEIKDIYANMGDSLVMKKQAEALLELFVQNMNKECPVFEEGFGTVDSFVLSNQCLIINFTLIEEVADPFFMQGKDNVKDLYRMQFMKSDPSDVALLEMCVDAGCGICYRFVEKERVYTGKKAKKRHRSPRMVKVCFSAEELREILQGE